MNTSSLQQCNQHINQLNQTSWWWKPSSSSSLSSPDSVSSSLSSSKQAHPLRCPSRLLLDLCWIIWIGWIKLPSCTNTSPGPQDSVVQWSLASLQWPEARHPGLVKITVYKSCHVVARPALNPLWGSYKEYNLVQSTNVKAQKKWCDLLWLYEQQYLYPGIHSLCTSVHHIPAAELIPVQLHASSSKFLKLVFDMAQFVSV